MSKTLLEQAKELLKNIQNDPKALQKFEELVKAHAEKSKHVEMEMSPEEDKKKRVDELSKRIKACMEKMQKESMDKDDKPHTPNTPEDKAHDVAEEGESVKEAIHGLKDKSEDSKKELLSHLRSLKDKSQLRSPENREAGKESHEKAEKEEIKPIHQMTRGEYEAKFGKPRKNTTVTGGFHPHKSAVEIALNSGKHVSNEVLKDYPELKKPTEKTELEKAKKPSRIEYYEDNQKGIHKPDMANAGLRDRIKSKQVQGKSFAGYLVREGKGEPENIHKEKLAELKAMPNPNLPKTEKSEDYYRNLVKNELAKAKIIDFKTKQTLADEGEPLLPSPAKGRLTGIEGGKPSTKPFKKLTQASFTTQPKQTDPNEIERVLNNKGVQGVLSSADLNILKNRIREIIDMNKTLDATEHRDILLNHLSELERIEKKLIQHKESLSQQQTNKSEDYYRNLVKSTLEKQLMTPPLGMSEKTESSKSVHGIPGKNRPLHSRGINEPVSVSIPKNDQDAKEKSLAGLKVRRKDISGAKEAHKEILSEMKAQKKPNLPKSEMAKQQVEPTVQPKPKAIIPAAGGSDNGDNKKPKKPVKFIFPKKTQKPEDYYKDLVKTTLEKGDVHDIKTGKKISSSPTEKTPKEAQPIVRNGQKGITTRKYLKQKFSPDIMPEEKDVPGGTETKKSN